MAVRPTQRRTAPVAAKPAAPKRQPARPGRAAPSVTEFANRPATPYHKAFAKWLVSEVGFDVLNASPKAAFLAGIRLAATARNAFNASEAAEEFYATSGEAKRGPKPKEDAEEAPAPARKPAARRPKPAPAPEPEPEEEEWEEEEPEEEAEEADEFEDDAEEEEAAEEEDEWEDEEEEEPAPAPAPKRAPARKPAAAPAKAAPAKRAAPAAKTAPTKRAPAKPKPADDDDDFIF